MTHLTSSADTPLAVHHTSKSFGPVTAISGVSLTVDRPGVIAILGQNGAGKTTLIRTALGLVAPDSGHTALFGVPSRQRRSRDRVGVLLQDSHLPDLLTGRELVELFASYYPTPLSLEDTLSLSDIEAFADKRYKRLSGGQKRRVQFALAIVGDPDLVFLDEPMTGLDADARRALWSVVRAFAHDGKTIILTTHYLEEADALADHIVIMQQGRIVADAPASEIRASLGGSVIRCCTTMTRTQLQTLPQVTRVTRSGRVSEIYSTDAVNTLRELLAHGHAVTELSVSRPGLEDVVTQDYS